MLPVKAAEIKFTSEYAVYTYFDIAAFSSSNYATPEQVLQGVNQHRLTSVRRVFSGRCGRTGGEPPSNKSFI